MNEFNPRVSIVIPVYNGSNYLREAISSALSQTYRNCEVIVVNDGSTDGGKTEEIAKSYGDRIRYITKKNGGVASALNVGVREMTGEYFSWLSHDDVYFPNKVEAQLQFLKNIERDVVLYSDFEFIDHESKYLSTHREKHIEPVSFRYALLTSHPIHGCTALIPKACFAAVGMFNEALRTTQDYDLWFRMAGAYDFVHIPQVLVRSRTHAEQGSKSLSIVHLKMCNDLYKGFLTKMLSEKEESRKREKHSKALFCMKIALNLRQRGYYDAADYAFTLSNNLADAENKFSIKYYFTKIWYSMLRNT